METAVLEKEQSVVVVGSSTDYVTTNQGSDSTVVDNLQEVFITLATVETVLVEVDNSTVVVAGQPGPAGRDGADGAPGISEEDMVYSKRIDFISDNELYKGEAPVGTQESAAGWRIRRVVIAVDGDVAETWASGTALFDKVWQNRLTYTYS